MQIPVTVVRPASAELPLDRSEVLRYLRYKPGITRMGPREEALVDRGIALALEAAAPAACLSACAISVDGRTVATRVPGLVWHSSALARLLQDAAGVTLVAATLGPEIEQLTAELFRTEEYALATVVDAAGSALVHGLEEHLRAIVGGQVSPLSGPGYGDWDIHDQTSLTQKAGGELIGLSCTETCYLSPQKSLVGIFGWTAAGNSAAPCATCRLKDCTYRTGVEPQ